MSDIELNLAPPPPPPNLDDTIVLGDSDPEDGEISSTPSPQDADKKKKNNNTKPKPSSDPVVTDDDIQVIGDNLFELDDDGEEEPTSLSNIHPTIRISGCIGVDTPTPKTNNAYRGTCFNCGQGHTLSECKERLDQRRIAANRKAFQGGSKKDTRIHDSTSQFNPGKLSTHALEALKLQDDEYPQWVYRMREQGPSLGYPPGYLKQLMPKGEGLTFFTDDARLSGKLEQAPFDFDSSKVVFYEGFNLIEETSDHERAAQKYCRRTYDPFTKETYTTFLEKYVRRLHEYETRKQTEETERRLDRKLMAKVAKQVERDMYRANEDQLRDLLKKEGIDPNEDPERYLKFVEENEIPLSKKDRKRLGRQIAKLAEEKRIAELAKKRESEAELKAAIGLLGKPAAKGKAPAAVVKQEVVPPAAIKKEVLTNGTVPAPSAPSTPARPKVRSVHTQTKAVLITELPEPSPEHKQQAHKQQRVAARETMGKDVKPKTPKPRPPPRDAPIELFTIDPNVEKVFTFPNVVEDPKPIPPLVVEQPKISTASSEPKPVPKVSSEPKPLPRVSAALVETGPDFMFPNGIKVEKKVDEEPPKAAEKPKSVVPRRFDSAPTKVDDKAAIPEDPKAKPSTPKKAKLVESKPKESKENVKPEKNAKKAVVPDVVSSPKKAAAPVANSPKKGRAAAKKPVESAKDVPVEAAKPEPPTVAAIDIVAQGDLNGTSSENGAPLTKSQRRRVRKKNGVADVNTSQPKDPWDLPPPKQVEDKPVLPDVIRVQAKKGIASPVNTGPAPSTAKQPPPSKAAPKSKKQEKRATKTAKDHLADLIDKDNGIPVFLANGKGHYDEESPVARKQARGKNQAAVDAVIDDSPASPTAPPVVSRALTEDQAQPREILVPTVDDRRMPNIDNFSNGILPFEHTNVQESTGRFDAITQLIKSRREEAE